MTNTATRPAPAEALFPRELRRAALAVFVVSLLIRGVWVCCADVTPISDFHGYDTLAVRWLETGEFGTPKQRAYRTPAYPGFLAIVYGIFGHSRFAATGFQALLGAVTSAMTVLLGGVIAGRWVGAIAGLLHAFSLTALAYVPVLASENLATPFVVAGLLCLAIADRQTGRREIGWIVASGLAFGLLLLVRPAALFFLPAWLLLATVRLSQFPRRGLRWQGGLGFVLATGVVLGPWLIRNHLVGLGITTLATPGGINLYMANHDEATHGGWAALAVPEYDALEEGAANKAYQAAAMQWIRENPGRYARLSFLRFWRMIGPDADGWAARYLIPDPYVDRAHVAERRAAREQGPAPEYLRRFSRQTLDRALHYLGVWRVVIAPLTLVAVLLSLVRWRAYAVVLWPALVYLAGISLTFGGERFREPSNPLLFILLAALLADTFAGTTALGAWPSRFSKIAAAAIGLHLFIFAYMTGIFERWRSLPSPGAPPPALAETVFAPIELTEPAEEYVSPRWTVRVASATTEKLDDWRIRLAFAADPANERTQYAGVQFPVTPPVDALRVHLRLDDPDSVNVCFVDLVGSDGRRIARWKWSFTAKSHPRSPVIEVVLAPGAPSGFFVPEPVEDASDQPPAYVDVFVSLLPQAQSGFEAELDVGRKHGAPAESEIPSR